MMKPVLHKKTKTGAIALSSFNAINPLVRYFVSGYLILVPASPPKAEHAFTDMMIYNYLI
jgi:hypothetical protein